MSATTNDELAAVTGGEKAEKSGECAYDKKHGVYSPVDPAEARKNHDQVKSTVSPFGSLK